MSLNASAWENHQVLQVKLLEQAESPELKKIFDQTVQVPQPEEEQRVIEEISAPSRLDLNSSKIPIYSKSLIVGVGKTQKQPRRTLTVRDLWMSSMVDEPDYGMDQDLPEVSDPVRDRAWMGGSQGPTSQGFRHMWFGGFRWLAPLSTLQFPFRSMGQAPAHFEKLKAESDRFFAQGNLFWGWRLRLWAIHFLQDLHQPFHVVQILSLNMIPWNFGSGWISQVTHSIANYHYAYEAMALEFVRLASIHDWDHCFRRENRANSVNWDEVRSEAMSRSRPLGSALSRLLPRTKMQNPDFDLTRLQDPDTLDAYAYLFSLDQVEAADQVQTLTCQALKAMANRTWQQVQ